MGREVSVKSKNKATDYRVILEEDEALFLPPNGLAGNARNQYGNFYAELNLEKGHLNIGFHSNTLKEYLIKVGRFQFSTKDSTETKRGFEKIFSEKITDVNSLRLLGLKMQVFNEGLNEALFEIDLLSKNQYIDPMAEYFKENEKVTETKREVQTKKEQIIMVFLFVVILFLLVFAFIKYFYKPKEMPKDLEMI